MRYINPHFTYLLTYKSGEGQEMCQGHRARPPVLLHLKSPVTVWKTQQRAKGRPNLKLGEGRLKLGQGTAGPLRAATGSRTPA